MHLGFNGENWFDAQDEVSLKWVLDLIQPGQEFTLRFRADKPDFNPAHINKLIELKNRFNQENKALAVIFCINVKDDAQAQMAYLDQVIAGGVNVIAVEYGNETYSGTQADFNFEVYKNWIEPLRLLIDAKYPGLKGLIFLAPRAKDSNVLGGRQDHKTFNDAAFAYINSRANLHPTVHIYLNERECPITATEIEQRVYDPTVFYQDLHDFYSQLVLEASLNYKGLWNNTLDYIKSKCPSKEIYVTEWGFDNYGDIKNTIGTGAIAWKIWNEFGKDPRITALLQHNGLSKAGPGMIFPVHPTNDTAEPSGGANKRRVDYWLYKMYRENQNKVFHQGPITEPGVYHFYVDLETEEPVISNPKLVLENVIGTYIQGSKIYSSGGATEWMRKNSIPSYEIPGITTQATQPYLLGYVTFELSQVLPINEPPVAVINPSTSITVYTKDNVSLSAASSYDPEGKPLSYKWVNESGEVLGTEQTLVLTYLVPKTNYIYLEVTDEKGIKDTDVLEINVKEKPVTVKPAWWCKYPSIVAIFKKMGIDTSSCQIK